MKKRLCGSRAKELSRRKDVSVQKKKTGRNKRGGKQTYHCVKGPDWELPGGQGKARIKMRRENP